MTTMSGSSALIMLARFLSVRVESVALTYGGVGIDPDMRKLKKEIENVRMRLTSTANGGQGEVKVEGKQPPTKDTLFGGQRCAGKLSKFVGRTMQDETGVTFCVRLEPSPFLYGKFSRVVITSGTFEGPARDRREMGPCKLAHNISQP